MAFSCFKFHKNIIIFFIIQDGLSAQLLDCMSSSGLDGSTSISNNSRNSYLENEGNRSIFNTNVLSPNIPEIVFTGVFFV